MRGFTLLELMVSIAILSVGATLAVPSLGNLARDYRSREGARAVMLTLGQARALAQQKNEVVRVTVYADRIDVARPTYSAVVATISYVSGWAVPESHALSAQVTSVPTPSGEVVPTAATGASFTFCPTGDATFLSSSTSQPLCALGDMMSNGGTLRFRVLDTPYHVEMRAALANLELVAGA